MCGIAGFFSYQNEAGIVNLEELILIRDSMQNRGPDGANVWISNNRRVGFAHRRLAILDLSEAAAQPMLDPETGNWIVFNGEIYNFLDLRSDLIAAGHILRSKSDTEVILKLYAIYGHDMLHKLRGMYAIAIWDATKRSLFMARDPLGIKPLYYNDHKGIVRFASQVKSLLKGGVDKSCDPIGHVGFYVWGFVPEPFTLYRGIRALPAGHWLCIDEDGKHSLVCFDNITSRIEGAIIRPCSMTKNQALNYVADVVQESIQAHLVADVPVGVFLSSGLDSAMIATVASRCQEVNSITLGFEEYRNTTGNEVPLAANLASILATRHSSLFISSDDFNRDFEKLIDAMDQPSIDGVNSWFVAKAAASQGIKVALSGVGGDELFATYPSFHQIPKMQRYMSPFSQFPILGKAFRHITAPTLKYFTSPKYAGIFEYGPTIEGSYLLRRGLFMPWELPDLMDPDMARDGWAGLNTLGELNLMTKNIKNPRIAITALEIGMYMKNQLLRDADWAGMAHSVEIRTPFADIELLDKVVSIFATYPEISKPQIANIVAKRLPEGMLKRHKTGFSMPIKNWIESKNLHKDRGLRGWAKLLSSRFGIN